MLDVTKFQLWKCPHINTQRLLFFFLFFLAEAHGGILVPQPEIEPVPSTLEAQSLNQWTLGEDPT